MNQQSPTGDARPREWTIRPFQTGDEFGIVELFNAVFAVGNPDFVPRTVEHWRWQFEGNPLGHQTFVAEAGGRIVAQYTALPTWWRLPGGIAMGAQALDTCVAPEYRRSLRKSGLFLTLADRWFDYYGCRERDQIVYGFPNPQAFRIGTKKVGYLPVHCPVPKLRCQLERARFADPPAIRVERITEFGREVDAFDDFLGPKLGMANVRNAEYLNWRYARNPGTDYRLLRLESPSGELRGFVIYNLGWHGDRKDIAPLVDWLIDPGDQEALVAGLAWLSRDARHAGLNEIVTWVPPNHRWRTEFEELGFLPDVSRFNLCIRIFVDEFDLADAVQNWYVVMGDSDIY